MKHEFKVTRSKDQTVYTLESASSGGTSSGSVASVSTALGGVQRRPTDSIFAQEAKKEEPKPRNFVAKNAKMGGAGKMKDKSKTIPRHEKHKKPVAEGVAGPEKCWPGHRKVGTQPGTGKNAGKRVNDCEKIKEQGVAEDNDGKDKFYYQRNNIWRVMDGDELVHEYTPDRYEVVGAKKLLARFDDEGYDVTHIISPMGTVTYLYGKPEDDMEEGAAEDHEIQMASSELQSIAKNAEHLLDLVRKYSEQQGLQAWQQSKITKAADYLNSVLQSINGEQSGMEEARNNYHANTTGFRRGNRDDERHDLDTQADPRETMMYNLTINGKPLNPEPIMGRSNLIKFGKQQQAAGVDVSNAVISPVNNLKERTEVKDKSGKVVSWKDETPWRKVEKNKQGQPKDPRGTVTNLSAKASRETEKNVEEDDSALQAFLSKGGKVDKLPYKEPKTKDKANWGSKHIGTGKGGKAQNASGLGANTRVGNKPVVSVEEDAYMMELAGKLAEKIPPNADVDYYINDFSKSTAPQFKGKNPAKRKQMAIAAYYGSKQKKK